MAPGPNENTLFSDAELTGSKPSTHPRSSTEAPSAIETAPADAERSAPVEHTWSVPELYEELSGLIEGHFGSRTWVTGELRSLNRSNKGHRYFELIEPGCEADYGAPRLKVTLFAGNRKRVNAQLNEAGGAVRIEEGTVLRICGDLRPYAQRSTMQLVMTGIDPAYTLGVVGQRREAVLAALRAEDLLGVNGALAVPYPAIDLALVTSLGSAAAADTVAELECAGVAFRVKRIDARTQGSEAENTLVAALRTAEELAVDLVLLVRGGGSASDLAAFDSERLARTIVDLAVPVFTGIGHETDRSVADEVAHTAHKTPTAAAAAVVAMATEARRSLEHMAASVGTAASGTAMRAERDLLSVARSSAFASRQHIEREHKLLSARLERIGAAAPLALGRLDARMNELSRRVTGAVGPALSRVTTRLDNLAALSNARDPRRMMELGWSVTHDSQGNLVRAATDVDPGDPLTTTLAAGTITSVVESSSSSKGDP